MMSLTISLTPEQVEQSLLKLGVSCRFTPEERERYATTPVVSKPFRIFGFPVPADNSLLTISHIKASVGVDPTHQPAFFDHPWYQNEPFMNVPCAPGWNFLTMDVLEGSVGQPWDYMRSLVGSGFAAPAAIEVILMLFLHYVQSGEQLLFRTHTWCADEASMNRSVTVGAFGRNGVFLSGHPRNFASRGLGFCGKLEAG